MRIYTDTSVIGGCFDPEFEIWSRILISEFKNASHIMLLSEVVHRELVKAPQEVRDIIDQIPTANIENLFISAESDKLAQKYIAEEGLTQKNLFDAHHIAIATIARADVLVSWNFKHIVNLKRIRIFNSVNLKLGYPLIEIRSPKEVLENGEEN